MIALCALSWSICGFRLSELLGTELICPIPGMNGAKFRIVQLMARRSPMTVSHEALNYAVNDNPQDFIQPTNTLKVHLSRARRALKPYGIEIETIWGLGYRIDPKHAAKWQELVDAANQKEAAA